MEDSPMAQLFKCEGCGHTFEASKLPNRCPNPKCKKKCHTGKKHWIHTIPKHPVR